MKAYPLKKNTHKNSLVHDRSPHPVFADEEAVPMRLHTHVYSPRFGKTINSMSSYVEQYKSDKKIRQTSRKIIFLLRLTIAPICRFAFAEEEH
jgi:hypothetical protein